MTFSVLRPWILHALQSLFTSLPDDCVERIAEAYTGVRDLFRSDFLRVYPAEIWESEERSLRALQTSAPVQAVLIYRISHEIFRKDVFDPFLDFLAYLMHVRTGMEVYYSSEIGEGFRIMHGSGLVLGPRNIIGRNFTVYQGVTLGQRRQHSPGEFLQIGDDCTVFAGARVLGKLKLGNRVTVAANAVLLCDAEEGGTYGGVPARRIDKC
jgi:serine O-acetyltransferase